SHSPAKGVKGDPPATRTASVCPPGPDETAAATASPRTAWSRASVRSVCSLHRLPDGDSERRGVRMERVCRSPCTLEHELPAAVRQVGVLPGTPVDRRDPQARQLSHLLVGLRAYRHTRKGGR